MMRPPPPDRGKGRPDDLQWRVVVDEDWTTNSRVVADRRCRWGSPRYGFHGAPAVAVLFRGSHRIPYAYCADHLYGRWIEPDGPLAGLVVGWRLRKRAA